MNYDQLLTISQKLNGYSHAYNDITDLRNAAFIPRTAHIGTMRRCLGIWRNRL